MGKLIDLTDRTFDMLTVIKRVEDRKPGRPMWLCQCECGNTVVVSSTKHDLTNQTFGFLKVIEPVKNERIKGNETRWKCLCQNCGRTVEVSSYWLRHSDPYGHCKCTRFNKPL